MFWVFVQEASGILAPRPGIEPTPPALEGKVLTTWPPGKFLLHNLFWPDTFRTSYAHTVSQFKF